jgi:hypothetical protein
MLIRNTVPPMASDIEIIGEISDIETIAVGKSIREIGRLQRIYGKGRWRKLKGRATVRLPDDTTCEAEVHWYEASRHWQKRHEDQAILWE